MHPRPFRRPTHDWLTTAAGSRRRGPARLAATVVLVLLATVAVVAAPASATSSGKGALAILAVNDQGTGLSGTVASRPFDVVVEARDSHGKPLSVSENTRVRLSLESGPGQLSGVLDAVIAKRTSRTTISGAVYSAVANGVRFSVTRVSGMTLSPATTTVNSARSAVRTDVAPGQAQNVTDPGCSVPTPTSPVCGLLRLPRGGSGAVLMSVGSCDTILSCRTVGGTSAELVTATADLKDAAGNPLYTRTNPATLVLACDKTVCGNGGVGKFPVAIDLTDTGAFTVIPDCPAKGVLGPNQDACVDHRQSNRDNAGDLYTVVLFVHDIRGSYP